MMVCRFFFLNSFIHFSSFFLLLNFHSILPYFYTSPLLLLCYNSLLLLLWCSVSSISVFLFITLYE